MRATVLSTNQNATFAMAEPTAPSPRGKPGLLPTNTLSGLVYLAFLHLFNPSLMQAVTLALLTAAGFVTVQLYPTPISNAVLQVLSVLWWMKMGAVVAYEGLGNCQTDTKGHQPKGRSARTSCCFGALTMGTIEMILSRAMAPNLLKERMLINGVVCVLLYIFLSAAGFLQRAFLRSRLGRDTKDGLRAMQLPAGSSSAAQLL
mmetsp:Transcript_14669/g.41256  ORF Transcript_14669/g.41256 Transcript_14669/m.41256 type:complete len:203 (+) Transcript_14669:402-1010(+)